MLTREEFESVRQRLASLPFAERMVLVGSSALFLLSSDIPPMTEDADVAMAESFLFESEADIRNALGAQGFTQVEGTATWLDSSGYSVDLLAFTEGQTADRAGGPPRLPAMIFSDLSRILGHSKGRLAGRPQVLSSAGFILSKLLTVRLEKGGKDRLHSLLLLAEHEHDESLFSDLNALVSLFPLPSLEDVIPEAQAAVIAAGQPGVLLGGREQSYASRAGALRRGFELLKRVIAEPRRC